MSVGDSIGGGGGAAGAGTGNVTGPASSTDNAITRWDLATGQHLQDSVVTVADTTGDVTWPSDVTLRSGAGDTSITLRSEGTGQVYFSNGVNLQASIDNSGSLIQAGGNGYKCFGVVGADGTVPAFIPDKSDPNTGLGTNGTADELSLIAGGVEAAKATANGLQGKRTVLAKAASPVTVAVGESRALYTNEGSGGSITFNLPAAAANLEYLFFVQAAHNVVVDAAGTNTIRIAAGVSSAGGTATNGTVGGVLHLVAINATEWVALSSTGTWALA